MKAFIIVAPLQLLGVFLEGLIATHLGKAYRNVLIKLSPHQFVDPGGEADIAIGQVSAVVAHHRL
ncbi:hypothetical protein HORIV_02000 [Vreelandella olivaria]|uniref:Uncharacterized protein n=1 Tax=Vreelandella olivaria TaxID=390919 RepID=A0ABM7GBP3_9GAMM|nr:hypothetical protein HORIV_02000 [Halomonas olivaria]